MAKQRFRLYHNQGGDDIAVIEMDDSLLAPDAGILDHQTMTLRPIKNGSYFTLRPVESHTVTVLRRLKQAYENTKKGAEHFSTHLNRVDEMYSTVGLLFGEVKYVIVESKDDLDKLINPPRNGEYEPKVAKYNVLGDMLTTAIAASGDDEEEGMLDQNTHVHGPNCKH